MDEGAEGNPHQAAHGTGVDAQPEESVGYGQAPGEYHPDE